MGCTLFRRRVRSVLFDWFPLVFWMALIFWLSDQPSLPHPGRQVGLSDHLVDYGAHALAFGILAFLAWRVVRTRLAVPAQSLVWSPPLRAGVFAALYAIIDELHQLFVPGRWAKVSDWLADVVGILVVAALTSWWERGSVGK